MIIMLFTAETQPSEKFHAFGTIEAHVVLVFYGICIEFSEHK